ncbi:MAG: acetolactate decarboxylase [Flavobacteriales bacterium]
MNKLHLIGLAFVVALNSVAHAQNGPVIATGAMRNTMFNGQLAGLISLDSLARPGTFGIGPVEYLRGELLVLDGEVFRSTVLGDSTMKVEIVPATHAPFFVHQHVEQWTEVPLPSTVIDLASLDAFLTERYGMLGQAFAFRMIGDFSVIDVHIVDVTPGTVITGPEDAHRENKHFHLHGSAAEAIGFFSTKHKAVFTHHDTDIHVHAITSDRNSMGHVEAMRFEPGGILLLIALTER